MGWFVSFHTVVIAAICISWIAFGYPRSESPAGAVVSEYLARTLTALVLLIWNAILN